MFKPRPHYLLFFVTIMIQIFIINQLSFTTLCMPIIYPIVIILYPMQSDQLKMLMVGFITGVCADLLMGVPGINTITLLLMSYIRIWILTITMGRDAIAAGGVSTALRFGFRKYLLYTTLFVTLSNTIFFLLESLDSVEWLILLERIVVSTAVTLLFVWLITLLFSYITRDR
ncbi:MAG: hypothetical protein SNG35_03165 [Rikenellaceae bacterium]